MTGRFRAAALIAAAALCASVFAACGEDSGSGAAPAAQTTSQAGESAPAGETEPEGPALPTGDYGGYEFNLLQYEETAAATSTICVEELNGDIMNDAIYERTQAVEERLNVKIVFTKTSLDSVNTMMRNCVTAGDDIYQAFWQHSTNGVDNFLMQGYLIDQNTISELDFTQPWWNDNAMNSLRLNEKTYLSFGDINYYLFDFQSILLFNKPLLETLMLSDPYQLVNDGKWTVDELLSMVSAAPADLNGDGALGKKEDRVGMVGFKTATYFAFMHGADAELFSRDENGVLRYDGVSNKYYEVLSKYSNVFGEKANCESNGDSEGRFKNSLTLFWSSTVGGLSVLRETEFDHGVVPFPKYDESQTEYISFITNQMQPTMIPVTVSDPSRCGTVLENLAAESYSHVRDKYFNVLVESKYVRDEQSVENLRMIYSGDARFEIEHIFFYSAGVQDKVADAIGGKADKFVSSMEKLAPKLEKRMTEVLDFISD